MAESFWWGGIGGVLFSIIGEMITQVFIAVVSPNCNTLTAASSPGTTTTPTPDCLVGLAVQWIMIPGFWEELFKAVWVCLRFKKESTWTLPGEDVCVERTRTE